jgi:hypothetical protein
MLFPFGFFLDLFNSKRHWWKGYLHTFSGYEPVIRAGESNLVSCNPTTNNALEMECPSNDPIRGKW